MLRLHYSIERAKADIRALRLLRKRSRRPGREYLIEELQAQTNGVVARLGWLDTDDLADLLDWLGLPQPPAPKTELRFPERREKAVRLYALRACLRRKAKMQ